MMMCQYGYEEYHQECQYWEPEYGGHPSTPNPCQAYTTDSGLCWPEQCWKCELRLK